MIARGRPALTAALGSRLRLIPNDPLVQGAALLGLIAGSLAASVPTGVQAHRSGAGVLGGTTAAVIASVFACALLAPLLTIVAISRDADTGLAESLRLSGQLRAHVEGSAVVTAACACAVFTASSAIAGALAGLGDSLRQSTDVLGNAQEAPGAVATFPLFVLSLTATAWALSRYVSGQGRALGVTLATIVAFVLATAATTGQDVGAARVLSAASPWAPAWGSFRISGLLDGHMCLEGRVLGSSLWLAAALAALAWSSRSAATAKPTRSRGDA